MGNFSNLTHENEYDFRYAFSLDVEERFSGNDFVKTMRNYWHYSIYVSLIYMLLIYVGTKLMESRPRLELKTPLIFWNFFLSVFSICGTIRIMSELFYAVSQHGFKYSVCVPTCKNNSVFMFWTMLFTMSKVLELGDTAFIVLRKQKLIFLHWYHHITVLVNVWFSIAQANATGRWYIGVNFGVHSLMYTYYFFRALKVNIPRGFGILVTSIQIVQMVIGCYINYTCYRALKNGEPCSATMHNILFSTGIYFTYLLLFASFFWTAYISSGKRSIEKSKKIK